MIIGLGEAKEIVPNWSESKIKRKLEAIESSIRAYTNNKFQNRDVRCSGSVILGKLIVAEDIPVDIGDTIELTGSTLNKGLFVIDKIDGRSVQLDRKVYQDTGLTVTKIDYPPEVTDCCIGLLEWENNGGREKMGISSETIGRHSVSYRAVGSNGSGGTEEINGYPAYLFGALKNYVKARF